MKVLEYLDFFPTLSTFTINQQINFKTRFGGCLTLLSIIICIYFSIDFTKDYFEKRNPRTYSETIYEKIYKPYDLIKDDLIIAWRLEDKNGNAIRNNDIKTLPFYPKAKFHKYKMIEGQFIKNEYITLNSSRCSDYFKENDINLNLTNKENWNCLDTSNITMGGYWNTEFLDYFDFTFDTCEEVEQNIFKNCVDYEKLKDFFIDEVYISFMFGKVYNENKNVEKPLFVEFYNFFNQLDLELSTYDICKFSYVKIKDDIGFFYTLFKEERKITFNYCYPNYSLNYKSVYEQGKTNAILYIVEFYLDNKYIQNHRYFSKISNVLSQMGGFFNFIFLILRFIYRPINLFKRNYFLLDYFFKHQEEDPEEHKKKFENFKDYTKKYRKKNISQIYKKNNKESNLYLNNITNIGKIHQISNNYSTDGDYEANLNKISNHNEIAIAIIREDNKENNNFINERSSINNIDNQDDNYIDIDNNFSSEKNKIISNANDLENLDLKEIKIIENQEEDYQKNIPNYTFNFKDILEKLKKSSKNIFFLLYYLSFCRCKSNKKFYSSLENGIFLINKKMELRRYFKNLQMLRIIGKITLKDQERFYFKNYYRELLDNKGVRFNKLKKEENNKKKEDHIVEYIMKKSNEDFDLMTDQEKMIFRNIFNQDIDD